MKVYWGRKSGGKLHMRFLSKLNSQTLVISDNFFTITEDQYIIKEKYTVKNRGVSPDGRLWIDIIIDGKTYYRLDEKSLKLYCSEYRNQGVKKLHFHTYDAYINPSQVQQSSGRHKEYYDKFISNRIFSDEERKRILHDTEKINTVLYNKALDEERKNCCQLGYTTLNLNAREIFEDVDILLIDNYDIIEQKISVGHYEMPPQLLKIIRESTNIVPIKSNLLDHVVLMLDSFSHHTGHKYCDTPVQIYKENKNILWEYLDTEIGQVHKVVKSLESKKIPYQYFDLDTDSYKDVFDFELDLPRDYTSYCFTWKNHMDRHADLEKIAKEYISLRNITTMKL
tara:strand:- start:377 stop:1393 length:1017 start_codon:yes stop_codon:yes gene_type:complete